MTSQRRSRSTTSCIAVAGDTLPRILFLTPGHQDYLADGLLHGLRTLLGEEVVDFPKAEALYDSYPTERRGELYGRGFSLYGLLADIAVDRDRVFDRARSGEFDLIVFADIWSTFGLFTQLAPDISSTPMAVLDGADRQEPYPYAGLWWRKRVWWTLPRAHTRATYFKRELTPATGWFRSFLLLPPPVARRLPSIRAMREISFSFPSEKLLTGPGAPKRRQLASHVVDPEVASRLGVGTSYAFDREADYYADLQAARFGITVKRAGWDCLRHYELAANGCVPCFRDLELKPPRCAPHRLDESNCVTYRSFEDLMTRLEAIDDARYASLRQGALAWARESSTVNRARQFLAGCGLAGERLATPTDLEALEQSAPG
jgi:hypothetical protein